MQTFLGPRHALKQRLRGRPTWKFPFWKICPQINAMKRNVHMSTGPEFEGNPNLRVSALSATSPPLAILIYFGINYRL